MTESVMSSGSVVVVVFSDAWEAPTLTRRQARNVYRDTIAVVKTAREIGSSARGLAGMVIIASSRYKYFVPNGTQERACRRGVGCTAAG